MSSDQITGLETELAYLEAHYAELPAAERQQRRGTALHAATTLANTIAEADDFDSAAYYRAYDLVLAFDRVGY
ncbi:hypothetical protein [Mycobacterium asiaticum]|uniref:Uncharacterized protein n=1 Tax=Mycobacterium asiaticum TaxID=1790 RepID=A0A1A3NMF8_MYCAS|nr:hypothetical protein [Mycobacterium asiaticum]OBK22535.1 hypothetical protein A5635_21710 [Mycobacterium asiaticum]